VQIPSSLFSGAIGAGVGGGGGLGSFSAGGVTGGARQVSGYSRGSYDPTLALGFSVGQNTSPLNSLVVSGVPEVTTTSIAFQARYSQAFPVGASLSVAFNNMRQKSDQRALLYNPSFVSQLSISVTQQLLSGFGLAIGKRFNTTAEIEQKITMSKNHEPGVCPNCGSDGLDFDGFFVELVDNSSCHYCWRCGKCGISGRECYLLTFNEHVIELNLTHKLA